MLLKQSDSEYFSKSYKDIFWINASSFKHRDIQTPYDWWYKINHKEPDTRPKLTGIMQHEYFLEREKFESKYVLLTKKDFTINFKSTQDGFPDMRNPANQIVKSKKQFENPGKEIIMPEDSELFINVKEAFERIRDLYYLLDSKNGYFEHSLYAFALFDTYGKFQRFVKMSVEQYLNLSESEKKLYLPVKCRMDYISKIKCYIIDLKCTNSIRIEYFKREIEKYGYHIQGSFYLDIASCIFEKQYDTFFFIVAENIPPFHSTKYIPTERMIQSGREDYIYKLEMIYKAIRDNEFPGLEIFSDIITYDDDGKVIENRQMTSIDLPESYYYRKNRIFN